MIKTCSKCKKEYPATLEFFYKAKLKDGFRSGCKSCMDKSNIDYRKTPEGRANKIKLNSKWREENTEKILQKVAKTRIELTDAYIASYLKMPTKQIPPEIIETKRLIMQLKRELKKIH